MVNIFKVNNNKLFQESRYISIEPSEKRKTVSQISEINCYPKRFFIPAYTFPYEIFYHDGVDYYSYNFNKRNDVIEFASYIIKGIDKDTALELLEL